MKDAVNHLNIPEADYLKVDTDRKKNLIQKGDARFLQKIRDLLIEINDSFEKRSADSANRLKKAGLLLKEKHQSDMFKSFL